MTEQFTLVIICGLVALLYGVVASKSIISADAGNEKMREIASAIQEGAAAYLNRQYITISVVGIVVTIILAITLGFAVWQISGFNGFSVLAFSLGRCCVRFVSNTT